MKPRAVEPRTLLRLVLRTQARSLADRTAAVPSRAPVVAQTSESAVSQVSKPAASSAVLAPSRFGNRRYSRFGNLRYGCGLAAAVLFVSLISAASSEPVSTNQPAQTWEQLTASAVRALKASNPEEAERLCREAMTLVKEPVPRDTRLARTESLMGEIQRWQKKLDLAEQSFKNAVTTCEKAVGPNDPEMISPLENLANFYYYTKIQYDQVAALYQRILNIVERSPAPNHFEVMNRARNLADVYQLQGRYAEAEPLYQRALTLAEKNNDDVPQYLLVSAAFYRSWKKYDQAESLAKRALAIKEKGSGIDAQLDIALCLDNLGETYLEWNKPELAEAQYRKAVALVEKISGPDNPDLAPRLTGLGSALQGQGKLAEAETEFKRALAVTEKGLSADAIELAVILEKYAGLLNTMKKADEAKVCQARAASIRKSAAAE